MLFFAFALVAGLAACVAAQSTENPFNVDSSFMVTAGQPSTVKWTPTTQGPVTLTLRSGAASDLNKGTVIACRSPEILAPTLPTPHANLKQQAFPTRAPIPLPCLPTLRAIATTRSPSTLSATRVSRTIPLNSWWSPKTPSNPLLRPLLQLEPRR